VRVGGGNHLPEDERVQTSGRPKKGTGTGAGDEKHFPSIGSKLVGQTPEKDFLDERTREHSITSTWAGREESGFNSTEIERRSHPRGSSYGEGKRREEDYKRWGLQQAREKDAATLRGWQRRSTKSIEFCAKGTGGGKKGGTDRIASNREISLPLTGE